MLTLCVAASPVMADEQVSVPVLCYHRFAPTVADSMTVTTKNFTEQMQWLKDNGYTVIPLKTLVAYLKGEGPAPAPKSVVITVDDGHKTVFTEMQPIVKKFNIPVTLFLYPSCISNPHAPYAMSWEQIKALQQTGLFDMQCHTFWHPNFKKDKKKMKPEEYAKSVQTQLVKSKNVLEKRLGAKVELLAWPFGIYDDYLESEAQKAGYVMAFSIDRRNAAKDEKPMAEPRYLMQNGPLNGFIAVVSGHAQEKKGKKSEAAF
ncbi:MAG: polysaccharide deacetylase family protein [Deltaproteobacteria bacterium]|nr:polysaccharide deacetylase family protein [Deltaproteobacteria bacterium]